MLDNITVLDFETTGLCPEWDFVTEIAAARVRNGVITSRFETLVAFGGVVPQNITELTGLTTEHCATGKEPRLAFALLRNFIGNDTIVAHNAAFDVAFLNRSYNRYGSSKPLSNPFLCTALLAQHLAVRAENVQLATLCAHYGIERDRAHRAMSDVHDTAQLLGIMLGKVREMPADNGELCLALIEEGLINRYPAPYVPGRQPLSNRWLPEYAQMLERREVARG